MTSQDNRGIRVEHFFAAMHGQDPDGRHLGD